MEGAIIYGCKRPDGSRAVASSLYTNLLVPLRLEPINQIAAPAKAFECAKQYTGIFREPDALITLRLELKYFYDDD